MTVLALSPHTDDAEFGAGATIARFVREGHDVVMAALSACEASVPKGMPDDTLRAEFEAAALVLGVHAARVLHFPVRRFPDMRQSILDALIQLRTDYAPDLVLCPARFDTHQDHAVVAAESVRAFKGITTLGYVLAHNCATASVSHWRRVEEADVERKVAALACYRSQADRPYAREEVVRAALLTAGTQAGCRYAEAFEVVRSIA